MRSPMTVPFPWPLPLTVFYAELFKTLLYEVCPVREVLGLRDPLMCDYDIPERERT